MTNRPITGQPVTTEPVVGRAVTVNETAELLRGKIRHRFVEVRVSFAVWWRIKLPHHPPQPQDGDKPHEDHHVQ